MVWYLFSQDLWNSVLKDKTWPREVQFWDNIWTDKNWASVDLKKKEFYKALKKYIPLYLRVW